MFGGGFGGGFVLRVNVGLPVAGVGYHRLQGPRVVLGVADPVLLGHELAGAGVCVVVGHCLQGGA